MFKIVTLQRRGTDFAAMNLANEANAHILWAQFGYVGTASRKRFYPNI